VTTLTCVVIEDEEMGRARLRELLSTMDDIRCVGEASDGPSAIQCIDELRPDLVFLDVELPGCSGLEVLQRVQQIPGVIFTTAFDQFAVTAFELRALDYLLKPFSGARLQVAISRARESLMMRGSPGVAERAADAMTAGTPRNVFVRDRGTLLAVPLSSIERIEGCDDYSALHTGTRRHLVLRRLSELESVLASAGFLRVHRSHIVSLAHVTAIHSRDGAGVDVQLRSGARVPASRSRVPDLRRLVSTI
jgi:two-component system LytT family response regulator